MAHARTRLIAGNWKMNGTRDSLAQLTAIEAGLKGHTQAPEAAICLPATLLGRAADLPLSALKLGGQDCHANQSGAHTGDISAEMLNDAGAHYVIVGHSERRADHGETDADIETKARAAWRAGLVPILCCGETLAQREAGEEIAVVTTQLAQSLPEQGVTAANMVIAYEPVWAIGTGKTATPDDVQAMHGAIRAFLRDRVGTIAEEIRLLYGGSVKPANAAELLALADVDGALVGGASLQADDFLGICHPAS